MGNLQTLADLISLLRRRALMIVALVGVGIILTLVYAVNLPRSYEAIAVIQVRTPVIAGAGATNPTSNRLQAIEHQLFLRENVAAVIARNGIFADAPALSEMEKVNLLRGLVRVQNIASSGATAGTDVSALLVMVEMGDPVLTAAVANDFAEMIVTLGSAGEAARVSETVAFFQREEVRIRGEITAIEAQITAFKNTNLEALPDNIAARRDERARLNEAIRDLDRRIDEIAAQRATIIAGGTLRGVETRQIEALEAQTALLTDQRTRLTLRGNEIDTTLASAPQVETTLSTFSRQLQLVQDQYAVASRRLAEAETNLKLAQSGQTEQFTILERAVPPEYSTSSGRRKVAVLGAGASVAAALGLAILLELLNPVLRSSGQVHRAVGILPVVAIPYIPTPDEVQRARNLRIAGLGIGALAVVVIAGLLLGMSLGA